MELKTAAIIQPIWQSYKVKITPLVIYIIMASSSTRGRTLTHTHIPGVIGMRVSPGCVFPRDACFPPHTSLGMRVSPHIYP